ncbi:hypothetical protein BIV57_21755 [Mangrovactinospora gilvigrisea]|uniref:2-dehydropantoate 2-reductase n=1 Tax=Mangrovactinospora gilvigrisea TaxID=1428644 RepID=A0A1J7B9T8_9ACTN|nr:2-dehydropantoate 2-reductase [Mangrovactinospora gilvigrisea]OIV35419.1 hypothetical protein BIV57_21755 [Mangrovactinospora gilvigrisea]
MAQGARAWVAVVGVGAVGTAVGVALADGGRTVVACGGSSVLDGLSVQVDGEGRGDGEATAGGDGTRGGDGDGGPHRHRVRWLRDPGQQPPPGGPALVVLAVKAHQTAAAAPWLRALAGPDAPVLVVQNGVEHRQRLAPLVPPGTPVVPALMYLNAERTGPGRATARRTGGRGLVVPDDAAGRAVAALFAGSFLNAETAADFRTAAWRKLLTNVAGNPITALTGRRVEVFREPAVGDLLLALLEEAAAVGRAEGAALPADAPAEALTWLRALPPGAPSSMLQDRLAGRELEHEALLGPVVRGGDAHGVPVPVARAVQALVAALRP